MKTKRFVSKWIRANDFVQVRVFKKTLTLKIKFFHKTEFSYSALWTSTFRVWVLTRKENVIIKFNTYTEVFIHKKYVIGGHIYNVF